MKVKQLIEELSKLPKNAEVLIPNRDLFYNGYYTVTDVDNSTFPRKVVIDTDYAELREE